MACVNWLLTIAAVLNFAFVVWPGFGNDATTKLVVGIVSLVVLILAWTSVICKPCMAKKKKK